MRRGGVRKGGGDRVGMRSGGEGGVRVNKGGGDGVGVRGWGEKGW